MDTSTLAKELGLTPKTIRTRAAALGLLPTVVSQGQGRPRQLWTQEQAEAIANYGSHAPQVSAMENLEELEDGAAMAVYGAVHGAITAPLQNQIETFSSQLEAIEDQAAIAMTHRARQSPARILSKMATLLNTTGTGVSLSDVTAGALGIVPVTPVPLPQAAKGSAALTHYLDNF